MLRSLLLKKSLAYGNAILAVVLAVYVVYKIAGMPSSSVPDPNLSAAAPEAAKIEIAGVRPISEYNQIVKGDMFGEKARGRPASKNPAPKAAKAEEPKKEVVTTLPLKLVGTVTALENDPGGSAIIENRSGSVVKKTYFIGDEVMDGIVLQSIHRRMVVLDNQRANQLEQLYLEEANSKFRPVSRASARSRADVLGERGDLAARIRASRPAVEGSNRIFTFNRQELVAELEAQYDQLASSVDVRVVKDANGNVQGVQASNISKTPLGERFGIQDGDVVQSVNGQKIESLDSLYDMVDNNQNTTKFSVQLMRGGHKQIFTYHLR